MNVRIYESHPQVLKVMTGLWWLRLHVTKLSISNQIDGCKHVNTWSD